MRVAILPAVAGAGAFAQGCVQLHEQHASLLCHLAQRICVQLVSHYNVLQGLGVQPAAAMPQGSMLGVSIC